VRLDVNLSYYREFIIGDGLDSVSTATALLLVLRRVALDLSPTEQATT